MKKKILLGFLCVMLVGCDNAKGLDSFTPEM
ncbi:MAG: YnfC family lipoprotein, partial [Leclercia sp.]